MAATRTYFNRARRAPDASTGVQANLQRRSSKRHRPRGASGGRDIVDSANDRSPTILVVDDEDLVRRLIKEALEREGYRVITARDGPEALAVSATGGGSIDLLITDVVMPLINGCELAKLLTSRVDGMRVVFMSGYMQDIGSGHLRRGDAFLEKPFGHSALTQLVREMVDRHPSTRGRMTD